MDSRTGERFEHKQAALDNMIPEKHIVEIRGSEEAIRRVSRTLRAAWKRRRKMQKASRRRNKR